MKLKNELTGDVLEVPPPNALGQSTVKVNGRIVERVLYSDENGGSVTLSDGTMVSPSDWTEYIVKKLESGEWGNNRNETIN